MHQEQLPQVGELRDGVVRCVDSLVASDGGVRGTRPHVTAKRGRERERQRQRSGHKQQPGFLGKGLGCYPNGVPQSRVSSDGHRKSADTPNGPK